jgi:hypothetical protein
LPVPPSEAGDSCDPHDRLPFNFEDTFAPLRIASLSNAYIEECLSMREDHYIEDTSPFDDLLATRMQPHFQRPFAEGFHQGEGWEGQPSEEELEYL